MQERVIYPTDSNRPLTSPIHRVPACFIIQNRYVRDLVNIVPIAIAYRGECCSDSEFFPERYTWTAMVS